MTRFACILLAICFIFCMLPGISLHASADDITMLQHISLDFALPAAAISLGSFSGLLPVTRCRIPSL